MLQVIPGLTALPQLLQLNKLMVSLFPSKRLA